MLISYNWLKEYVDIKLPPAKLAELLTMSGLSVDYVKDIPGDTIINIEITSNRPDWLSYIGVAREIAAITGCRLKVPSANKGAGVKGQGAGKSIQIRVEDKVLCARYTGRVITDVKIGESPKWLRTKLEAMGLKPVNNVVDITNFCLFETGEPMHAFDLDKIAGGGLIVRKAQAGEKITTIDGVARSLDASMLVIADREKPIAVAGVMGGLNTEVTASTKNILLEAARFDPVSVRRTARKLGIATESSYRFERRVDPDSIKYSSDRATGLILELAGGAAGAFADIGKKETAKKTITLRLARLNGILGIAIPQKKVEKILCALGLKKKSGSKGVLKFEAPGFRNDLQGEVDLIEEVARANGYDKIPLTIPVIAEQPTRLPPNVVAEGKMRGILTGLGASQIITYSLMGKRSFGMAGAGDVVEIKNPLTSEQEAMRPSLLAGMLGAINRNINRKSKDLKLFELGNVYIARSDRFDEAMTLSMAITGQMENSWNDPARPFTFYDLKGMLETLFCSIGASAPVLKELKDGRFSPSASAAVEFDGRPIGVIGEVSRKVLANFDIKSRVYYLEIDAAPLTAHAVSVRRFRELPRYPSVLRDISVVVGKNTRNIDIESAIRSSAGPALGEIKLVDKYEGEQIPRDKIGLTYRLEFRDPARTLEEKDVAAAGSAVLDALKSRFGAALR